MHEVARNAFGGHASRESVERRVGCGLQQFPVRPSRWMATSEISACRGQEEDNQHRKDAGKRQGTAISPMPYILN